MEPCAGAAALGDSHISPTAARRWRGFEGEDQQGDRDGRDGGGLQPQPQWLGQPQAGEGSLDRARGDQRQPAHRTGG